jgi:hypothetical protein
VPSRRPPWAWLAGIVVTVALLWWVLHDVDWAAAAGHVRRANLPLLVATVAVATSTFVLRAVRWRLMLRDGNGAHLAFLPLWRAVAVGFMANNLLPARAGEFARAWVVGRAAPVRVSTALASIAVERMLDGLTILALLAVALVAPSLPDDARVGGVGLHRIAATLAAVFGGALLLSVLVVVRPEPWLAAVRRLGGAVLPTRFAETLAGIATGLVAGLAILRSPGRLFAVVAWSAALWLVNAASLWLCFGALHMDVPPESALLLQGLIAIGVAIPAAPGFFGVFEAIAVVALGFYGVDKDHAVSYAVVYHITTFIPITLLGLHALAQLRVRLGDLRTGGALPPTP